MKQFVGQLNEEKWFYFMVVEPKHDMVLPDTNDEKAEIGNQVLGQIGIYQGVHPESLYR